MFNKSVFSLLILYLSLDVAQLVHVKHFKPNDFTGSTDWDFLIFTQHWPATVCKAWVHNKPNHSCSYPNNRDVWTIHGSWPTKLGTKGPFNCNSTWLFDPEQVKPIEDELEQSWTNIEKGTPIYDFWAHEWNKHGTCAAAIEPLNSELKYFSKGLEFLKTYSMTKILGDAKIFPSDIKPVTVAEINEAIVSKLGKRPSIQCKYEDHVQYLFELRICFDKELKLIDCAEHLARFVDGALTNCNVNADIIYPDQPPRRELVQLYKFTNWLQWLTL
ncbi:ribonuclease X25 [Anticarsia gemmatalis]|uniref:ribonuclease X25 n=1 Tax=Anticarsia gemmatalis TaxID=129554 RepID=UPI003F772A0E